VYKVGHGGGDRKCQNLLWMSFMDGPLAVSALSSVQYFATVA